MGRSGRVGIPKQYMYAQCMFAGVHFVKQQHTRKKKDGESLGTRCILAEVEAVSPKIASHANDLLCAAYVRSHNV